MVPPLEMPRSAYVLAFREGVTLAEQGAGFTVAWAALSLPVRRGSPGLSAALGALSGGGATEDEMSAAVTAEDGEAALPVLFYYLERFKSLGLLSYSSRSGAALLATLAP